MGGECEFLRAIPAHFGVVCGFLVLAGGFGVDFSSAQMCGWCGFGLVCGFLICDWRGFGLFCSFLVHRPPLFLVYGVYFGQIFTE